MGQWIALQSPSGEISAWRAEPVGSPLGALVVVQEIFGVNGHIRSVVDRFAEAGYSAIAPALFDHFEPRVELGYDKDGVEAGRDLVGRLGFERAVQDVDAAARLLDAPHRTGVVGFCWGGTVAFLANTRLGLPAVSYYGGRTVPYLQERTHAPLMLHFGESDPIISPADVQRHHEALPAAEIHVWPAGHGFNCDQRGDYNATVAIKAMQCTLAFLALNLR